MHGVKRRDQALLELIKTKEKDRVLAYKTSLTEFNDKVKLVCAATVDNIDLINEHLGSIDRLLEQNPEHYTAWNTRRRFLLRQKQLVDAETYMKQILYELQRTATLLKLHPKSYWLFNHRRWCLTTLNKQDVLRRELLICEKMLSMDSRNCTFSLLPYINTSMYISNCMNNLGKVHAWDYRRWVIAGIVDVDQIKEFEYSSDMISKNFSNYSAWHYRSKLVERHQDGLFDLDKGFTSPDS
jgi:geranylgeranyl transferase type-2 subunit alpha